MQPVEYSVTVSSVMTLNPCSSLCLSYMYIRPVFLFSYQLLKAQADYHRRSLTALEAAIPTIQMQQGERTLITFRKHDCCVSSFSPTWNPNITLKLVVVWLANEVNQPTNTAFYEFFSAPVWSERILQVIYLNSHMCRWRKAFISSRKASSMN